MSSRRCYPLQVAGGRYIALRKGDLRAGEQALAPPMARQILERAMRQPREVNELALFAAAVQRGIGGINRAALNQAVQSGQWVLLAQPRSVPDARPSRIESTVQQINTARLVKTWVEMEVLDESGKPAAGRRYSCMLPDGVIQTGTLDSKGRVRFDGIDPGNCAFSLTDTHAADWDWAA
ncbi:MAG TPA: hypothetical protein VFQ91_19300 [Bryobacteraceae bacterium]|nr:hypothetical protein [Bryobacteraceae bacterium]